MHEQLLLTHFVSTLFYIIELYHQQGNLISSVININQCSGKSNHIVESKVGTPVIKPVKCKNAMANIVVASLVFIPPAACINVFFCFVLFMGNNVYHKCTCDSYHNTYTYLHIVYRLFTFLIMKIIDSFWMQVPHFCMSVLIVI